MLPYPPPLPQINREAVSTERLIEAGELLHAKLEAMPKDEAKMYAPQFKMLCDLIEKRKGNGQTPKDV